MHTTLLSHRQRQRTTTNQRQTATKSRMKKSERKQPGQTRDAKHMSASISTTHLKHTANQIEDAEQVSTINLVKPGMQDT